MNSALTYLKQNKIRSALIGLALLGLLLYANTFRNQMFWDDNDFILNNQFVQNFNVGQMFSENVIAGAGFVGNYWRPVLLFVFSIEYHLWGAHPFGYHLVNLALHIADALLIFFLLQNLFGKYKLSLLTALVFLIHPLQTEAVTYVNSLGDSLSVFFMLLGLNNFLHFRSHPSPLSARPSFWWSIGFYPLALMSKETAIIYPGLVFLIEVFVHPALDAGSKIRSLLSQGWNVLKYVWPNFAIAGLYVLLRATILNFQNSFNLYNEQNAFTAHISVRIFTFFKILATYFGLLFYPHNLHMERSLPLASHFLEPAVLIGAGLFLLCLILIVVCWKKRPAISFGLLWFLIGLAPTSNILVPINGLLYEHWLYLPMIGLWIALFSVLFMVIPDLIRNPVLRHYIGILGFVGITLWALFLTSTTIARNSQWHDPIRFYNQTLEYAPDSYRVINNLGMAYDDANDHQKAIEMYQRAIQLGPNVQVAYHNLGNAYKDLGQNDLAIQNFEKAIQLDPNFFYSYNAIADLYLKQNQVSQALAEIKKLQALYPQSAYPAVLIEQLQTIKQ